MSSLQELASIGAIFATACYFHFHALRVFLTLMPQWVPWPETVIVWTGIAELLGAIALVQPFNTRLRKLGGWSLALYTICVFPVNIKHFALDMQKPDLGWGLGYHVPRMFAQPLLAWLLLWASTAIEWPWRTPSDKGHSA